MKIQWETDLIRIIESDIWMMNVLKMVRDLNLNDCWIGAGFVRNKIWDELHGKNRTVLNDVDVIYFDESSASRKIDVQLENKLKKKEPYIKWSVKNQSRMGLRNGHNKYSGCKEAISYWPETATSIAIRLNNENKLEYIAPYGLDDLFGLLVQPTPKFDLTIYANRMAKKKWEENWDGLEIRMS